MNYYLFQVKTALQNFRRNKVRTFLTSLGIMIGVLSVVVLIALGIGLKNYIQGQFEDLGANLIIVLPGSGLSQGAASFGPGLSGGAQFDEKDLVSLQKIDELDFVSPAYLKGVTISAEGKEEFGYAYGTNADGYELANVEIEEGELLTPTDLERKSKKVNLGSAIAEKLFENPADAVGQTIRLLDQRFTVVGVLKKKGDNELDSSAVMSYKSTYGVINPNKTFFSLNLGVLDEKNVEVAKQKAEEELLKRYKEDDFSISEQAEILSAVNSIFNVINTVLLAIGSISLIVGGIGIMNIMYANVTERTKEIGIRRAIGATRRDILLQFLTESVLLSLIGGISGLLLAILIVLVVKSFFPVGLNAFAVIAAFGISTGIGVFFGVFPARRAASLTPIEAIRYE
jgi:putative ABC transport system permease protein